MREFRSMHSPKTKDQIAVEIATDAIEEYRFLRMSLGSDAPETEQGFEILRRLSALMKGPHGKVVRPVVFKAFPELEPPKGSA